MEDHDPGVEQQLQANRLVKEPGHGHRQKVTERHTNQSAHQSAHDRRAKMGVIYEVNPFSFRPDTTFYRSSTQVSQNWMSIINFYVNSFGEWAFGSEETKKMGDTINIPRQQ